MKITKIPALLVALLLLPVLAFSADLGRARLSLVQGDVQVNSQESGEWFPVSVNTPLREGDRLWVPPGGRSEIQLMGGTFVRLDEATSFDFLAMDDKSLQFYLGEGRVSINNQGYGVDYFQIDTPLSSIGCYDNALVTLDVTNTGAMELSVLRGYAFAETRNGKIRITAGNALRIGADLAADTYPLGPPDEWAQWNRERDGLLAAGGDSQTYLPAELDDYVSDFENNGRWFHTADYGYVWTPAVAVSVDWAPYRMGRWVWFGGNYVWISYEPWGWVPYHYGRWAFLHRVGWCWVPPRRGAVFWAPGYVAWVHAPTFVSWVPLAPGEIYYSYGNYGPGSLNITNVTVNNIVILKNLRNVHVRNAVTVMHRDAFLHGRKTDFRMKENPFTRRDMSFGPPRIKPDRAGLAPVIRKVPAAKLPPQRIRAVNPDLLRKERRLVRDERGSVFAPGRQVREMPAVRREAPGRLVQERKPAQGEVRTAPGREDGGRKERQMRQRETIGPVGTERPGSGREKSPLVTPPSQRRPAAPPAEPRPGVKREDVQRRTAPAAPVTPLVELPGGTPAVTPRMEQRPRVNAPQKIETRSAPQPVAPTPVWRPPQTQHPPGRSPEGRQPQVQRPTDRIPAGRQPEARQPSSVTLPAQAPRVQQPRREERSVQRTSQPVVQQERVRQEPAAVTRSEYRPQTGPSRGVSTRAPYQGERGGMNR
jgi:hypothetical protein